MRSSWATVLSLVMFPVFKVDFGSDEHDVNFLVGYGAMLHAARDDYEFPFTHDGFVIAELHAQSSFNDEKTAHPRFHDGAR